MSWLGVLGFSLAAVDFFGLTAILEAWLRRFQEWLEDVVLPPLRRVLLGPNEGGEVRWIFRVLVLSVLATAVLGAWAIFTAEILDPMGLRDVGIAVLLLLFALIAFVVLVSPLLSLLSLALLILSYTPKGIVGTGGFILAAFDLLS